MSLGAFEASSISMATSMALAKVITLKKCLEDSFIADRTDKSGAKCFILRVLDGWEDTGGIIMANPCRELLNRLPWFPLHLTPESMAFSDDEFPWVVLFLHEVCDDLHGDVLDFYLGRLLLRPV